MKQRGLFDQKTPIVHSGDPETSAEAAENLTASGRRGLHCKLVLELVRENPGSTAIELWHRADALTQNELKEPQEVRRRLTDLKAAGAVQQKEPRTCKVRGSRMVTWTISTR